MKIVLATAVVHRMFYDGFAARYNKHFCIGETGAFDGGTAEEKKHGSRNLLLQI